MDNSGVEELSSTFDDLTISPPLQSTIGSGRMDSEEGVGASPTLGVVTFLRNATTSVMNHLGDAMNHLGGGGHKRTDGEDSSRTDVLELRESPPMEMPAAEEYIRKLLSQKEKEMEDAAKLINDLLTQKDELSESVSQSDCRNMQLQDLISRVEHDRQRLYDENISMQRKVQRLQDNRLRLEANERKLHLQIQSLERERANEGKHKDGSYVDSSATPVVLEAVVRGLHIASRNFTKAFIRTNVHGNKNADKLIAEIQFSRPSDVKYAHQAHLSAIFFCDFEREDFGDDAQLAHLSLPHQHPTHFYEEYQAFSNAADFPVSNVLPAKYTEAFNAFCCRKYLGIFHKELDLDKSMLQCGQQTDGKDLEADGFDLKLLTTFFQLARIVWMLHRLAFSFEPNARVIRVGRGAAFNGDYMAGVPAGSTREEDDSVSEDTMPQRVALVVLPGFSVCKCIVKSLVYVIQPQVSTTRTGESQDFDQIGG
jgi:hypothetical protein